MHYHRAAHAHTTPAHLPTHTHTFLPALLRHTTACAALPTCCLPHRAAALPACLLRLRARFCPFCLPACLLAYVYPLLARIPIADILPYACHRYAVYLMRDWLCGGGFTRCAVRGDGKQDVPPVLSLPPRIAWRYMTRTRRHLVAAFLPRLPATASHTPLPPRHALPHLLSRGGGRFCSTCYLPMPPSRSSAGGATVLRSASTVRAT